MKDNRYELPYELDTPVLFLIFNRPDTTRFVFEAIRQAKPKKLYIAADGPRASHPGEEEKVRDNRDYVMDSIDWDCEVKTLFREKNLGCKIAVSSAIDWFFSEVDEGIILEDDCVPDQSFFPFCQELLERYRNDERVMMITGTNYLFLKYDMEDTYFFSKYYIIWGWATWKRAWQHYDIKLYDWPKIRDSRQLEWIYSYEKLIDWYYYMFQLAFDNGIDTWDIQWWYSCVLQNGLCIVPKYNLISNIGEFGHFSNGGPYLEYIRMPTKSIDYKKMIHPSHVVENGIYDRITVKRIFEESKHGYSKSETLPTPLSQIKRMGLLIYSIFSRRGKK